MSKQKYAVLTFEILGLPDFIQDQIIVSSKEIEIAQKCILLLKKRIKSLCILSHNFEELAYKPVNHLWIPHYEYPSKSLKLVHLACCTLLCDMVNNELAIKCDLNLSHNRYLGLILLLY